MVISEVDPVMVMLKRICRTRIPSVTMAMDSPSERTILSMTLTLLKKTNVQAKENDDKADNRPESRKLFGKRHREIQKLVEFHDLILLNKADDCNCIMN